jgi:hypothetical protein
VGLVAVAFARLAGSRQGSGATGPPAPQCGAVPSKNRLSERQRVGAEEAP